MIEAVLFYAAVGVVGFGAPAAALTIVCLCISSSRRERRAQEAFNRVKDF